MNLGTVLLKLAAAREMVGVNHAANVLKSNRDTLRKYREGMLVGSDGASLGGSSSGEEMMVLGDVHQTITHAAPDPQPPKKSGWGKVAKLALAGGLLATGFGASYAIPLAISALKPEPAAVQPTTPATDTDSDTATELNFWDK
jgi:hypothetical protein